MGFLVRVRADLVTQQHSLLEVALSAVQTVQARDVHLPDVLAGVGAFLILSDQGRTALLVV